jgi:hypothetical protein
LVALGLQRVNGRIIGSEQFILAITNCYIYKEYSLVARTVQAQSSLQRRVAHLHPVPERVVYLIFVPYSQQKLLSQGLYSAVETPGLMSKPLGIKAVTIEVVSSSRDTRSNVQASRVKTVTLQITSHCMINQKCDTTGMTKQSMEHFVTYMSFKLHVTKTVLQTIKVTENDWCWGITLDMITS